MSNKAELIRGDLLSHIDQALTQTGTFYAVVAFLRVSGLSTLMRQLRRFLDAGGEVKLLTGDYLYITEPEALRMLLNLGPNLELRLWRSFGRSFHPKAYLFETDAHAEVIVGSSNLSRSGLTSGVEWNLKVKDAEFNGTDPFSAFLELFYAESTEPVNPVTIAAYQAERDAQETKAAWREVSEAEENVVEVSPELPADTDEPAAPDVAWDPRPAQQEALEALSLSRQEGFSKGLVVLPTGLGKTYLAALFAKEFQRVLFVAHREEILRQAERTFRAVIPDKSIARYDGHQREEGGDLVFASVYTLAAKRHRERFNPARFDLIVVDEFHHAAARSYQALMQYFRPQYLLGLTATPDRADNKDVYALCDGNLVYQVSLSEAINRGWLAPFSYFGVADPIDYTQVTWRGTHYDEGELTKAQLQGRYGDTVVDAWMRYHGQRTLVFCSSRSQSRYLAERLRDAGVRALHVDGMTTAGERRRAVSQLFEGAVDVICSVDLFNEGVDIPAVDTILLARPTDSMVVFLQQIGRGLRLTQGKTRCAIIDLVGNYRHVDRRLEALGIASLTAATRQMAVEGLPKDCEIELDFEVIQLLRQLRRRRSAPKELLRHAYLALKAELGRRPTYLEFHLQSGVDSGLVRKTFHSYVGFLEALDELTPDEFRTWERAEGWLNTIERTTMQKSYKMVLLQVMLERGSRWTNAISANDAAAPFFEYLHAARYRHGDVDTQRAFQAPFRPGVVASKIAEMPMHHLAQSAPDYFELDDRSMSVRVPADTQADAERIAAWTREIVEYRLHRYFYERTGT
ncbi:DEAD/DEAH box helicase family protein [Sulfobacillus harzensis]|uniref:DEAD/DEAH box helicase family protein n=1 Tax=Sulfobacillus harzensis TaxID=2729629 RepID=A0A7Y0Q3K1_9FIRM|nr:DEAD/DEAH box helicase family protein [Sulfobacillus harzensis]NMP23642.1 DEAD/DEAH box helicase family protein [Sulfobacillus harzensis]